MAPTNFRVVIVGGGISGLTLANALERANVDYLLLEGREQVAPFVGASIAITANGGRVLDQLGCYDAIEEKTVPMDGIQTWKDGALVARNDFPLLGHKRSGYPFVFMDRHFLLQTLYDGLTDQSKILLGKRVMKVDHSREGISVHCRDGTTYAGDVVVGADGVSSMVRREMWRHMSVVDPCSLSKTKRTSMYSDYNCMYGVSKTTHGFRIGTFNQVLGKDLSFLHSTDKSGRVFWFVFEKLDKRYHVPDVPKFTKEDGEALAERCLPIGMTDKASFQDLWDNRISYTLVPLEEAWYNDWTWGRFACIGDSIHKWTPNTGQGGNNAIESAAAIANVLHQLVTQKSVANPPSHDDIHKGLDSFHCHRKARAKATFTISNLVTRLEALRGPAERLIVLYVLPNLGDWLPNQIANNIIGSEKLDFLPDPEKSFCGTMAYNQNYGIGHEPSTLKRGVLALPLLLMAVLLRTFSSTMISLPQFTSGLTETLHTNQSHLGNKIWDVSRFLEPLRMLVTAFSPSLLNVDPTRRLQALSFVIDTAPLYLLWVLESHRRANIMKLISFPVLFGIASQFYGIGVFGPLFFFLHYVQSPLADYTALDWRLVNVAAARTALIAIALGLILPTLAMYSLPDLRLRLSINAVWQAFPVLVSVSHYILRKLVKDTTQHDRLYNVQADLPYIRFAIMSLAVVSMVTFNWVRFTSSASMADVFLPSWNSIMSLVSSKPVDLDLVSGMRVCFQLDEMFCFAAAFGWLALLISDMKEAELTHVGWVNLIMCAGFGTLVTGPGAVLALAWLWREEILASKRMKGAVARATKT